MKRLLIIFALLTSAIGQTPTRFNLGQLPTGSTAGQLLQSNGTGADPSFTDPIISLNYVILLNGQGATAQRIGTYQRIPNFSTYGTLSISATGITGSPVGCSVVISVENNLAVQNSGTQQTINFTPGNNYQSFVVNLPASYFVADMMAATYNCATTFPTAGTINVVFTPANSSVREPVFHPTYRASKRGLATAASATDIATLSGNATNTVVLLKILVSCTQTTAGIIDIQIIKRSTADSAGTSTGSPTSVSSDSNNTAAISSVLTYTANPTLGTAIDNIDSYKLSCLATSTASPADIYIYQLKDGEQPIVLHGTAEQIALNLNSTTVTGSSFDITFVWKEKP